MIDADVRINVTLTASDNTYLTYPVDGELQVWEISTDQYLAPTQVFRVRDADGTLSAPVEVRNVQFVYRGRQ